MNKNQAINRFLQGFRISCTRSQATTIILHRHDTNIPIIHNLKGLWEGAALEELLQSLVQEHYEPKVFSECAEILWQDNGKTWGQEILLEFEVHDCL